MYKNNTTVEERTSVVSLSEAPKWANWAVTRVPYMHAYIFSILNP